jgi:hypothetical protein
MLRQSRAGVARLMVRQVGSALAVCSPGAMRFSMPKGIFVNGISIP